MKKNKNGKRMLSLLLSLVMLLLSLLPMQVMADTDRHGWEDDGREHDQIPAAAGKRLFRQLLFAVRFLPCFLLRAEILREKRKSHLDKSSVLL